MKFLLDENVPNKYKLELETNGFKDIKRINDFGKGLPDNQVYKISLEEERILITIDKDFYAYKKEENSGVISLSGKLETPIEKVVQVMKQIQNDQRFSFENYKNVFIRITNQNFVVIYKKKNKYKEIICNYKKR